MSCLKDDFGGRDVRWFVTAAKVMCHCMFVVLALTEYDQLVRLVS